MKITVTIGEIMDKGRWMEFCQMYGWNDWCVAEGQATTDEEVVLSEADAKKLGFLKGDDQ